MELFTELPVQQSALSPSGISQRHIGYRPENKASLGDLAKINLEDYKSMDFNSLDRTNRFYKLIASMVENLMKSGALPATAIVKSGQSHCVVYKDTDDGDALFAIWDVNN